MVSYPLATGRRAAKSPASCSASCARCNRATLSPMNGRPWDSFSSGGWTTRRVACGPRAWLPYEQAVRLHLSDVDEMSGRRSRRELLSSRKPLIRAVADFLLSRGARHHIFSAIAMNLADEVRRLVAADPSALTRRQSRNENHRTPLHFAVLRNRQEMIALLLGFGADPLAVDGSGQPLAVYVSAPETDRRVMELARDATTG